MMTSSEAAALGERMSAVETRVGSIETTMTRHVDDAKKANDAFASSLAGITRTVDKISLTQDDVVSRLAQGRDTFEKHADRILALEMDASQQAGAKKAVFWAAGVLSGAVGAVWSFYTWYVSRGN